MALDVSIFTKCWHVITYPLYILVLICLFRVRKTPDFDISFYKFVTSLGCFDLLNMAVLFVSLYSIDWGLWSGKPLFSEAVHGTTTRLVAPFLFGTGMGQHLGVFFIAFDRVMQFFAPIFHNKLWDNNRLKIAIFFHWFLAFCCGVAFYWEKPIVTVNITEDGTNLDFGYNGTDVNFPFIVNNFIMIGIAFIVLFCYVAIFIKAVVIAVQHQNETAQRMALNTVVIGFSISSCLLCMVGVGFLVIFGIDMKSAYVVFQVCGDLYTGLNPYCLLVFATNFRTQFKEMYFCKGGGATIGVANGNQSRPAGRVNTKPRLGVRSTKTQPRVHVV